MISFIVCLLLLITGYLTYGKIVDKPLARMIVKRRQFVLTMALTTLSCRSGSCFWYSC